VFSLYSLPPAACRLPTEIQRSVYPTHATFRPTPENHPVAKLFPERFDFSAQQFPVAQRASEREAVWLEQSVLLGERQGVDDAVAAVRKVQQHADELR
jgi:hypothetical protein